MSRRDWKREMLAKHREMAARVAELEAESKARLALAGTWKSRAEQAERERDEAHRERKAAIIARQEAERDLSDKVSHWRDSYREAHRLHQHRAERAERAEADNAEAAELLVQLFPKEHRDTWVAWLHEEGCRAARDDAAECECDGEHYEDRIKSVIEGHPGAALLERLRALEKAGTEAAAELRHAYRVKEDWNLVARAIRILEEATTPKADALRGGG